MARRRVPRLYGDGGAPNPGFNAMVKGWLELSLVVAEHSPPKAFDTVREAYDLALRALLNAPEPLNKVAAHKFLLSSLTDLLFDVDLSAELAARLPAAKINDAGFRTTLAQAVAKNAGENFTNAIVYALSDALGGQDEVLVDKGLPPHLRQNLTLKRTFHGTTGEPRVLEIPIETDLCIFSRSDPTTAIIVSAKTRLKEVFHIGTMWKLLFDMIGDEPTLKKWGLEASNAGKNMLYVFATADMISKGGRKTQGPDVEREQPRNLIAMDASFFDYVFVSKRGIPHVAGTVNLKGGREALFHELGTILDLIAQHFAHLGFQLQ